MTWMECRFCGRAVSRRELQPGQALRCACGALVEVPKVQAFSVLPPPCPRCWQPLSPMQLAEGTLHRCAECAGVFAECRAEAAIQRRGEAALAGMSPPEAPPRAVDLQGYARCPLCANLMNRVQFARRSGVLVDVCRDHGTWFDASELERVAAFATELASESPPVDEESRVQDTSWAEEEARRAAAALGEQLERLSQQGPTAADRADTSDTLSRLPMAVLRRLLWWIAAG